MYFVNYTEQIKFMLSLFRQRTKNNIISFSDHSSSHVKSLCDRTNWTTLDVMFSFKKKRIKYFLFELPGDLFSSLLVMESLVGNF